jgi:hypothetical protein
LRLASFPNLRRVSYVLDTGPSYAVTSKVLNRKDVLVTASSLAIVLAGHGDITQKNAYGLLDLNVPEGDISPYTTERVARNQKGLKTALGWFEEEGLEVERTDDPINVLLKYAGKKDWSAWLVLVNDPDNEEDKALIALAHEEGITVKDLTGAFDDILPVEQELESEETPQTSGDFQPVAFLPTPAQQQALLQFADFILNFKPGQEGTVHVTRYREGGANSEVLESVTRRAKDEEDAPFDNGKVIGSATKKPGTTKFLVNDDGQYRLGEGKRKKSEETVVYLSSEEVASLPRAVYDPED